mgnify:CR=1 FL=1
MAKATISMVSKSIQSFIKQNLIIAYEVIEQDDTVDELFNRVKKETISLIHEDPRERRRVCSHRHDRQVILRESEIMQVISQEVGRNLRSRGEYKGGSL